MPAGGHRKVLCTIYSDHRFDDVFCVPVKDDPHEQHYLETAVACWIRSLEADGEIEPTTWPQAFGAGDV